MRRGRSESWLLRRCSARGVQCASCQSRFVPEIGKDKYKDLRDLHASCPFRFLDVQNIVRVRVAILQYCSPFSAVHRLCVSGITFSSVYLPGLALSPSILIVVDVGISTLSSHAGLSWRSTDRRPQLRKHVELVSTGQGHRPGLRKNQDRCPNRPRATRHGSYPRRLGIPSRLHRASRRVND